MLLIFQVTSMYIIACNYSQMLLAECVGALHGKSTACLSMHQGLCEFPVTQDTGRLMVQVSIIVTLEYRSAITL